MFAALQKMGVPEKNIQTSELLRLAAIHQWRQQHARRLTGYQVSNDVTVRLEDVGKVGGALDALVAAGANQMNGISFSIAEPRAAAGTGPRRGRGRCPHPRRNLCQGGRRQLGPILSISEGGGEAPRPDVPDGRRHGGAASARLRRGNKPSAPTSPWYGKSTDSLYISRMTNPFFEDWTAPFEAPPLDRIQAGAFRARL